MRFAWGLVATLAWAAPAFAGVHESSDDGFVVRHAVDVPAEPDLVWETLIQPSRWWSRVQTYSREPANLSLDAHAGGCLCEIISNPDSPRAAPRGSVEHMRVVYIERPRALRMVGALGPLSADALNATLTIFVKPLDSGSRIMWEYVVGGYMRKPADKLAAAADVMLAEQISGLARKLGADPTSVGAQRQPPAEESSPASEEESGFITEMESGIENGNERDGDATEGEATAEPGVPVGESRKDSPDFIGR